MIPTHKYLVIQPENIEPAEFTYFEEWSPLMADANVISTWTETLGLYLDLTVDIFQAADTVSADPRFTVYLGDGFIEIYRMVELPPDAEFETDANRLEA